MSSLIDRYVNEVGKHLPRKNRADIQVELRSALVDALEDRVGGEPSENETVELLKEFGAPKNVAASYFPEGQYLIGPALFPLFRMVFGIVLAAVIGAQIIAWLAAVFIAQTPFSMLEAIGGVINSVPAALGMVVIVFAILQRFDVRPETDDEAWDPKSMPEVGTDDPVKRGELVFDAVVSIVVLVALVFFIDRIGFITSPGGKFFANPVIVQYVWWISFSLLIGIGLDLNLLWQGRWTTTTRVAKIASHLLGIVVLVLLYQGHTMWLVERGAGGFFTSLQQLPGILDDGFQVIGMQMFRFGFGVALIVTAIETIVMVYRLVRVSLRDRITPIVLPLSKTF